MSVPHFYTRTLVLALMAILLTATAVMSTGCAANKCDCPKFGGHRLKH